jgi:succinyl-diaminopimelate desuccinylase
VREIVDLTKDLIRFKSTHTRPEEIQKCARFIETWFKDHDIACTVVESNGVPSIRALPARQQTPLLLMSHIDVVNATDPLFEPIEKNGRLYGRGAIDDKYAVALSMVLLKNRIESNHHRGLDDGTLPLGVLITGDEEVGGYNGARSALGRINCDFCIALDGGRVDKIVVKEKGILRIRVVSSGKTAHGARPWQGENAIEKLMADCLVVKGFFEGLTEPEHWHRTMNLSVIRAGDSVNQVPDEAEATFDIRYTENDDVDDLVQRIQAAVTSKVIAEEREPLFISPESPYRKRLLALATDTRIGIAHGASDARFLSQFNIPGIVWGADGNSSQHSTEEHVEIPSLARLYDILDRFVTEIQENPS